MKTVSARDFQRNFKEWRDVDCIVEGKGWRRYWLSDKDLMSDKVVKQPEDMSIEELKALPSIKKASEIKKPKARQNDSHLCKACGWVLVAGRCGQKDCKKQGKLQ